MRTNEERIAAMHARAAEIEKTRIAVRVKALQLSSAAVALAAVILLAVFMPDASSLLDPAAGAPDDMHASIFGGNAVAAYITIAVIAFVLGVCVTAFCFRLKKWQKYKEQEIDR